MAESNRPSLRLLVVDDDEALREALLPALAEAGYAAEGVPDGAAARERLNRLPAPDVVVLDMILPYVNGRELLAEMRRSPRLRRIRVIAISADGSCLADAVGADALLPKPFSMQLLVELVERVGRK